MNQNQEQELNFQRLARQLKVIASSAIIQEALQTVSSFSGNENVTSWVIELEKVKSIHGLADQAINQLAWSRSKGIASTHIGRLLKERADIPWHELRAELEKIYGNCVDKQQAFARLKNIRQNKDENAAAFSERLLYMADRSYGPNWRTEGGDMVNQQLSSIFLDGLRSIELKTKLYGKGLTTLMEVVEAAKREDMIRKRFHVTGEVEDKNIDSKQGYATKRTEEPMEVDHFRRGGCFHCGGPHRQRDCRRRLAEKKAVQIVDTRNRRQQSDKQRIEDEDRKYRRCFFCHRKGHFARQCRQRLN